MTVEIPRQKIRVGIVVPSLEIGGGVPTVAKFIVDVAIAHGFDFKLISLSTSSHDPCNISVLELSSYFSPVRTRVGNWRGFSLLHVGAKFGEFEFQRYRRRESLSNAISDCDVIQVVCGSPAWGNSVIGCNKPVSLQVATRAVVERRRRDYKPSDLAGWWRKLMTFVTNYLDDRALKKCDSVQVENPWMYDYCKSVNIHGRSVDIRYSPPGIDITLYFPIQERIRSTEKYVLCVGRLDDPRKNVEHLLRAFAILAKSIPHVKLITAGSGAPPEPYWMEVQRLSLTDRVIHIAKPEFNDLVCLYQNATCFALSSDEEGLGMVILEAMACGVPVVATMCGGPDGIITDGDDGFLVPLDSPEFMAERLLILCTDLNRNSKMGECARKTIEMRYSKEVTGEQFATVWGNLAEKKMDQ